MLTKTEYARTPNESKASYGAGCKKIMKYKSQNVVCQNCKVSFIIDPEDFNFYEKIKVPPPTFCPECRYIRRLLDRNEYNLYKRKCDATGKDIISIYRSDAPFPVYNQEYWKSDKFDGMEYGRNFDFDRSFFEQYEKLRRVVPHLAIVNSNSVNSEYTNQSQDNKDCYMLIESSNNERCNHCYWMQKSKDCLDCAFVNDSELCYEVFVAWNCYKLFFSKECRDCTDSYFLRDCIGLSNCYSCVGLRNKQYHIFNKPYSKEEYSKILEEKREQIKQGNVDVLSKEFKDLALKYTNKYAYIQKSVRSTGNYLLNAKDCICCFHGYDAENCKYGYHVWRNSKDNMDVCTVGRDAEMVYESSNTGIGVYNVKFGMQNWGDSSDIIYSESLQGGSTNIFGCIGLRNKEYCIFNKQYSKFKYWC